MHISHVCSSQFGSCSYENLMPLLIGHEVASWMMECSCKYRWNFLYLLTACLLLWSLVYNRPWTGMMTHDCNLRIQEDEAGGSWVPGGSWASLDYTASSRLAYIVRLSFNKQTSKQNKKKIICGSCAQTRELMIYKILGRPNWQSHNFLGWSSAAGMNITLLESTYLNTLETGSLAPVLSWAWPLQCSLMEHLQLVAT